MNDYSPMLRKLAIMLEEGENEWQNEKLMEVIDSLLKMLVLMFDESTRQL